MAKVASIVPPVLTCLVGRRLGDASAPLAHFALRDLAASLVGMITKKYAKTSHTLKPRLARTCLKHFLDPNKPLGAHYGAIMGLQAVGGPDVVRALILPNLKTYATVIKDEIVEDGQRKAEAEMVLGAILITLRTLENDRVEMMNGQAGNGGEEMKTKLIEKVGELVGTKVFELGRPQLSHAVLEDQVWLRGS